MTEKTMTEHAQEASREHLIEHARAAYPILQYFVWAHLPEKLRAISEPFSLLAYNIALNSPKNAETSAALRKLLEAKDCAVRAAL